MVVVAVLVAPVEDVVAHIEAELRAGAEEDAQHLADVDAIADVSGNEEALLRERLALDLDLAAAIECSDIDAETDDRQLELRLRAYVEAGTVGLAQCCAAELHLRQLQTALQADADLRPYGAN